MKTLRQFAWHSVLATAYLVVVVIVAIGIENIIQGSESRSLNLVVVYVLRAFEYILFGVDCLLFIVFIIKSSWKTMLEIWND